MTCAPGWTYFPHTEKCYQHVEKNSFINHAEAETACKSSISPVESTAGIIGDLASVPDNITYIFLMAISENKSVWIGGKRDVNNGWFWSDGSAWIFSAWHPREPTETASEIYLQMNWINRGKIGWSDSREDGFGLVFGYICQYHIAG